MVAPRHREPAGRGAASDGPAEMVGPAPSAQGFLPVLREGRQPAALDLAARRCIEDDLFTPWISQRMHEAEGDLTRTAKS